MPGQKHRRRGAMRVGFHKLGCATPPPELGFQNSLRIAVRQTIGWASKVHGTVQ